MQIDTPWAFPKWYGSNSSPQRTSKMSSFIDLRPLRGVAQATRLGQGLSAERLCAIRTSGKSVKIGEVWREWMHYMGGVLKQGYPHIIHLNRIFPVNQPFCGNYPYFRKPPSEMKRTRRTQLNSTSTTSLPFRRVRRVPRCLTPGVDFALLRQGRGMVGSQGHLDDALASGRWRRWLGEIRGLNQHGMSWD